MSENDKEAISTSEPGLGRSGEDERSSLSGMMSIRRSHLLPGHRLYRTSPNFSGIKAGLPHLWIRM